MTEVNTTESEIVEINVDGDKEVLTEGEIYKRNKMGGFVEGDITLESVTRLVSECNSCGDPLSHPVVITAINNTPGEVSEDHLPFILCGECYDK